MQFGVYVTYKNREKMPCNGICIRHKVSRGYGNGHKRCNHCNLYIKWDGLLCPCCGYKLRVAPRHSKFKAKLREQKVKAQAKEVKILYYYLPSA
jgi:predicted amidophosphoribosyltransferase